MLNLKGEMIGLTTALAAVAGYEQAAGYAIPVDETFRRVVDTLKQGREVEYGFLGVQPERLGENELHDGRHGVRVGTVVPGTPASRFDLRPNDIITHVDGRPVRDPDNLILQIGSRPAEAVVRLTVERKGEVLPINVELMKYFVRGKKIVTETPPGWRGMRVDFFTAVRDLNDQLGHGKVDPDGCVWITDVEQGSPAWNQGLRPNTAISHVGNVRVGTPREFQKAVAGKTGPVKLRLVAPADRQPVRTIPPEAKTEAGELLTPPCSTAALSHHGDLRGRGGSPLPAVRPFVWSLGRPSGIMGDLPTLAFQSALAARL